MNDELTEGTLIQITPTRLCIQESESVVVPLLWVKVMGTRDNSAALLRPNKVRQIRDELDAWLEGINQ